MASRAVYELTAVEALVEDEDRDGNEGDSPTTSDADHLVAHVRVRLFIILAKQANQAL